MSLQVLQIELTCNLGLILVLQLLLQEQTVAVATRALCTFTCCDHLCLFLDHDHGYSCLGHLPTGLLYMGLSLKSTQKLQQLPNAVEWAVYMHSSFGTLTFIPQTAVVSIWSIFLSSTQGVDGHLSSPSFLGHLWDHLSLVLFSIVAPTSEKSFLQKFSLLWLLASLRLCRPSFCYQAWATVSWLCYCFGHLSLWLSMLLIGLLCFYLIFNG